MLLSLIASAALLACPVEDARYTLRGSRTTTAEFHPVDRTEAWPSGVAVAIHVGATHRTYWFLPWNGGTDDRRHVRLTRLRDDPVPLPSDVHEGADLDFWTVDAAYNFADGVPRAGQTAPAHFVLPDFGRAAYYWTVHSQQADAVPRAFFDLTGCQANSPANVVLPVVP